MHSAYEKQKKHAAKLKVGDRVAYSALFLKSTQQGYAIAKMRGVITQIGGKYPEGFMNSYGDDLTGNELLDNFCLVQWDKSAHKTVNTFNLAKLKSVAFTGV